MNGRSAFATEAGIIQNFRVTFGAFDCHCSPLMSEAKEYQEIGESVK